MNIPAVISKKKFTAGASQLENPPNRNHSRFAGRAFAAAILVLVLFPSFASAQNIGMVADAGTNAVIVFDGDADIVLGSVSLPSGGSIIGDCAITADRTLGFVTDFNNKIWVIDLSASPPILAAGTNPITISNFGEDLVISPDGQYLIICDGGAIQPVSVVDIATRTEVSTFMSGKYTSVDVCPDGSALVTEFSPGKVHRLILDAFGNLTHSGDTLNIGDVPVNVYCAPDGKSGVIVEFSPGLIRSFTIPGLAQVDVRFLTGNGLSGVFNNAGDVFYVRGTSASVEAYSYNSLTGAIGATPLFTFPSSSAIPFFGIDQIALHPLGQKLYVPQPGVLEVFDATNGAFITSITDSSIVSLSGVSFSSIPAGLICIAPGDQTFLQCAPTEVQLPIFLSDTCGGVVTCQITLGPGTLVNDNWVYTPAGDEVQTVAIECVDTCGNVCVDTFTITFDINDAPVCYLPGDTSVVVCPNETISLSVITTDTNGNFASCQITSGPGTLDDSTWLFSTLNDTSFSVTIVCSDSCGETCSGSFIVTVIVDDTVAPVITCPSDLTVQCTADVPPILSANCSLFGTAPSEGNLYRIDPIAGTSAVVGNMGLGSIPALAVDPVTGVMYLGTGGGSPNIYTVDTATAQTTFLGNTNLGFAAVGALEFDAAGNLFASVNIVGDGGTGSEHLARINKNTGNATIIGPYGGPCGASCSIEGMEALSFDNNGQLWGAVSARAAAGSPGLYTIDTVTGAATFVRALVDQFGNPPSGGVVSLKFGCGGALYGGTATALFGADGGKLISIDTATGSWVSIASVTNGRSLGGLASGAGGIAVTDNCDPNPVLTLESETSDNQTCPETITRVYRATDDAGNFSECTQTITVDDTIAPLCAITSDTSFFMCAPVEACVLLSINDNCDTNITSQVILGPGTLTDSGWCYTPSGDESVLITVRSTDDCGNITDKSFTAVFEINDAPICVLPNDTSMTVCPGELIKLPILTTDPNGNLDSCYLVSGPGAVIDGFWQFEALSSISSTVTIECADSCGATCSGSFTITVNVEDTTAPVITCPPDLTVQCAADVPPPEFDLNTAAWKLETQPPVGIEGAAGGVIGDKLYISHGYTGFDNSDLYIYDIPSNSWTTGPSATFSRSEMAGGVADGKFYAIGGRTFGNQDKVECYDPITNSWATVAPLPTPRGGLGAASLNGKIYAIGGRTGGTFGSGTLYSANEVYDPVTNSWTSLTPMPTPLSDVYATVAYAGKVYVFGGALNPSNVTGLLQIYDPNTNTWTTGSSMPTPRAAAMCGVLAGRIAVFGGYDPSFGNLGVTEFYDPSSDTWTTGPDLATTASEIAQGPTFSSQEIFAVGSGIFGVRRAILQTLRGGGPVVTDNCDPNPVLTLVSESSDNQTCPETITRVYRATDDAGNFSECTRKIIINDTIAPVCFTPNDTALFLCANTQVTFPAFAIDNCTPDITCELISGPGQLIGNNWVYTPLSDETDTMIIRCVDSCGNVCVDSFVIEFDINAPPVCVLPADTIIYQCLPAKISLPVSATDEDGNLVKCEIISGPGTLTGGVWEYDTFRDETFEVTIRCVDQCGDTCVGSFEVQVDINQPPILTCPSDTTMPWVSILQIDVSVFDNDLSSNPNEIITYMLGPSSPGFATIDQNGRITLTPQGGDVCDHVIEVFVIDICGVADTCEINICVTNERPVAICDTATNEICWGQTATGIVLADDPDSGPLSLQYSVVSFDGPGTVDIDPQTGEYTWITIEDAAYISPVSGWTLCVKVSDNANLCDPCSPENADTCCVSILVVPTYRVCIETADDVLAAGNVNISISIDSFYTNYPMAGWDFLFKFDNSALSILGASPGGFFAGNDWEYFTYRFGANGNCGTGCPGNEFRVVAFAETNDKFNNPSGYTNQSAGSSELFVIHFLVSSDHSLNCQFIPISWLWYDCGDNAISSVSGDSLFISRFIYTGDNQYPWADNGAESIHDNSALFPTGDGAPGICMVDTGDGKPDPLRKIDFKNGGVIIICDSLIDARGDMNLNGLANEIADAVVYTSYFIKGISAFDISPDGQTAASDVNADGIVLTVADLVLLIRIISGDAQPIPKLSHYAETVTIQAQGDIFSGDYPMGAALFIFEGEAEVNLIQDSPMRLETGMRNGNTYALILPDFESAKDAVIEVGPILSSSGVLLSVEAADYNGNALNTSTKVMPTSFVVRQNYPNPFNPSTKISFDVAVATSWNITIYNITGQKVEEFNGYSEAGTVEVVWNAVGSSSGVYLYRVTAGAQTATRKMALLK